MEVWTSHLKEEAGVDECPETSCRCIDPMIGLNREAASQSLEINTQNKDWQDTEGRGNGKHKG